MKMIRSEFKLNPIGRFKRLIKNPIITKAMVYGNLMCFATRETVVVIMNR